ncbi:hypothetical protein [Streptomyces zaomyceticus]|uniref:hypothetical protein n=1 Tax=Streptomyces zaomyceticus TaxID=68286 RepID=UPI0033A97718
MTNPADELKAAARTLRETATAAQAASPGTWAITSERVIRCDNGDGVIVADRSCADVGEDADLPYIALMGPGVGHALADLLDDQADGDDEGVINPWALAVARAINGDAR